MRDPSVAGIADKADEKHVAAAAYRVLYDGQCEVCQAGVSWLKALDHEKKTVCLPISAEALSSAGARLDMDDCLRELHVVGPQGEVYRGWALSPASPGCSWRRGSLAYWGNCFRSAMPGEWLTGSWRRTGTRSASAAAALAVSRSQRQCGGELAWGHSGRATRSASSCGCRWSSGLALPLPHRGWACSPGRTGTEALGRWRQKGAQ